MVWAPDGALLGVIKDLVELQALIELDPGAELLIRKLKRNSSRGHLQLTDLEAWHCRSRTFSRNAFKSWDFVFRRVFEGRFDRVKRRCEYFEPAEAARVGATVVGARLDREAVNRWLRESASAGLG